MKNIILIFNKKKNEKNYKLIIEMLSLSSKYYEESHNRSQRKETVDRFCFDCVNHSHKSSSS